jgi:hypothetical protein
MIVCNKPQSVQQPSLEVSGFYMGFLDLWNLCLPQEDDSLSSQMKLMLIALGFPKPPNGITAFHLFTKLEGKVCSMHCSEHFV